MSLYNDTLKLKLAWQTAREQRTCPDGAILYAETIDENLQKHLAFCLLCRDNRAMGKEEKAAWQTVHNRLVEQVIKPEQGIEKQSGQVWTLRKSLGKWQKDGRYMQPPAVLLLESSEKSTIWKVAQLYEDRCLMGNGDVALDDRFGFAEGWNCYPVNEKHLDRYLGGISLEELEAVITASFRCHERPPDGSILDFFRNMEVEIGSFLTIPAISDQVEESKAEEQLSVVSQWLEDVFGSFSEVFSKLKSYELPIVADDMLGLLSCARTQVVTTQLAMATSPNTISVNIVNKLPDGEIRIKTITASITDDDWQDSNYFIAGKLDDELPTSLHLLSSLVYEEKTISECINQMSANSPYFDIVFRNVPREASKLGNVKLLLVCP